MKLLVFTASWCKPCQQMKPILQQLDEEVGSVEFEYLDMDSEMEVFKTKNIRGVPTLLLVDDKGNEVARKTGSQSKNVLIEWVKQPELF